MNRRDLPIFELENALVAALRTGGRLILQAPTGSGKSTQVPQMLLDHGLLGNGEVVVLQPRRLATRMLAARVAGERQKPLGDEVGYQIRFDRVASERTRIRFVTEGVLLRQLLQNPRLEKVSAIIFDEFHERHLYGDITLARALDLQQASRPDLKLIVMSATLETARLDGFLAPCATLRSEGRAYPVEIEYLARPCRPEDVPVWDVAADELERMAGATQGDVLIFMPGAFEIHRTIDAVRRSRVGDEFVVLPLHGELPVADQDAALAAYGKRKVVVSTNVAETSLTIDGVRVVIDSGLARIARFDPYRGINTLLVEKISRASADQRAGRAGRTAPGVALRLWTEREHMDRPAQELPEVKRLDLSEVVLTLKASGVEDIAAFRWLEPPEQRSLDRAETLLKDLGALHEATARITAIGRRMLAYPAHPRYARMLLEAGERGCVRAIALIAALSQGRGMLRRPENRQMEQDRADILGEKEASDFFILTRAYRFAEQNHFNPQKCKRLAINGAAAREAGQTYEQFLRIAKDEKLDLTRSETADEAVQRCILAGFTDQVAMRIDTGTLRCNLVHGRRGVLARESVVHHSPLLVASDVREIQGKDGELTVLLNIATAIEENWLRELLPDAFHTEEKVAYDPVQRRVVARRQILFRDLLLKAEVTDKVPREEAAQVLAAAVISGTCVLVNWDHAVEQWITRLNRLREWMPELELPAIEEAGRRTLIEQLCHGATTYKDIKERAVWPVVKSWLSAAQMDMLEKFAPERIGLPNGKKWKITYDPKAAPFIAARIQELYGVEGSLAIAAGRVPLVIQVLAPNQRPVQVTQNLSTFWKEAYPKLKQELQRKYPKHEWR
ncbi:MAG TPA: ATP-dependent helicase HrpB [Chthoniobacteraceae bacterium]|jgi:ATP-dependent helicase HrpB|nr:ATP-dependent helicase HrpB [Chthoniobacteraceae bacterium]